MLDRLWAIFLAAIFLGTALTAPLPADDGDDGADTASDDARPPVDPKMIRLHLMDGSVISGKLSVEDLELETQFGTLTVPVTELRSFTPGLVHHPELGKKVYDLIDALGANDFDEREKAQKELVKLGSSVRVELEKRRDDKDAERRTRIKTILDELETQQGDEEGDAAAGGVPLIERDTVETSAFTAVGKILNKSFTVASLYGPLTVKLGDIRRGERDSTKKTEIRRSFSVEGTNLVQRGLKASDIRVERGDKVTITADGTVTMTPWGNNMVSTPDGGANFGWYVPNSIAGGSLVAAIGDAGSIFKVGSKSSFRAQRSGALRFGVAMQNEYSNQNFPGRYNLKIRIERK